MAGDITTPETASRATSTAIERYGSLDVLVNNSGLDYSCVALLETDFEFSRRVMDASFFGSLLMLQVAARAMTRTTALETGTAKGAIVNVASRAGRSSADDRHTKRQEGGREQAKGAQKREAVVLLRRA